MKLAILLLVALGLAGCGPVGHVKPKTTVTSVVPASSVDPAAAADSSAPVVRPTPKPAATPVAATPPPVATPAPTSTPKATATPVATPIATPVPTATPKPTSVSVKSYGAVGNGSTNDTAAIQKAIDFAVDNGIRTVVFPAGVYVVDSVCLAPGLSVVGQGATIKKIANADKWSRTFTTECSWFHKEYKYAGHVDSALLEISGFTFDGNRAQQSAYKNYELQQQHMIFLYANRDYPGRLKAYVHDIYFHDGVADGLSVYANVDVRVENIRAKNVFRGGITITGGYSKITIDNYTHEAGDLRSGLHVEVDGEGYGGSHDIYGRFDNLNIHGYLSLNTGAGNSEIIIGYYGPGANVVGSYDIVGNGSPKNRTYIYRSKFTIGGWDGYNNRIVWPGYALFKDSSFTLVPDGKQYYAGLYVQFNLGGWGYTGQQVSCDGCTFKSALPAGVVSYAAYAEPDSSANNNLLAFYSNTVSRGYSYGVYIADGGTTRVSGNSFSSSVGTYAHGSGTLVAIFDSNTYSKTVATPRSLSGSGNYVSVTGE